MERAARFDDGRRQAGIPVGGAALGGDFAEGVQHEASLVQAGMRHDELDAIDALVAVEQQVDVEGARPPVHKPRAASLRLDGLAARQKLQRAEGGVHDHNEVVKRALTVRPTDGRRLEDLRAAMNRAERLQRERQRLRPRAQVAAESKHRFYRPRHADVVSQAARQTLCRTASNSLISSARDDKLPNS